MVVFRLGSVDLDAQGDGRQAVRLAALDHGLLRVGQHFGGLQVAVPLVDHDFHGGVLQFDQLEQGGVERQMGKATAGSGNEHDRFLSVDDLRP